MVESLQAQVVAGREAPCRRKCVAAWEQRRRAERPPPMLQHKLLGGRCRWQLWVAASHG